MHDDVMLCWWALFRINMEQVEAVSVVPCIDSKFVQPYRIKYKQNGKERLWDCTKIHDSVAVLIFNRTKKCFVFVRQFRPAVYMSKHRALWENSDVFSTTLSQKPSSDDQPDTPSTAAATETAQKSSTDPTSYGHGSLGCTYELCAGIVDKAVSLEQIAKEEVLEETGYDVPLSNIEYVNAYYSSIGHAGSRQTMYYCEVTDEMIVHDGGGNEHEGELIDVVHIPHGDAMKLAMDGDAARSTGLCFAVIWFEHFKKQQLGL